MTRSGINWLCPLVFVGICAVGAAARSQSDVPAGTGTSLRLSDQREPTSDAPVGSPTAVSPKADTQGDTPRPDAKPNRRPTVYTPTPSAARQNPGRGGLGTDPKSHAVPNPLRDGAAGAQRPRGTPAGLGESKTSPQIGPDGQPRPASQFGTPNEATSPSRTGANSAERSKAARPSTSPFGKPSTGPVSAVRIEQPKPQSWWNKVNPFRKSSQPAGGEAAMTPQGTTLAPSSANSTRRAFNGPSQQAQGTPASPQVKTEWAFGKRLASVPATPTATRTEQPAGVQP